MSSVNTKFAVLALAGSAVAVPSFNHGRHHGKHHHHNKFFFGSSGVATGTGAPYGMANATGVWGTGTAVSSNGLVASSGFPHSFVHPSAIGPHTASSEVAGVSTSICTDSVVSVTHTNRVTITVHASSAEAAPVHTTFSTKPYSSSAVLLNSSSNSSSSVALSSAVVIESSSTSASSSVSVVSVPTSSAFASVDVELQIKGHRKWTRSSTAAASTAAASTAAAQTSAAAQSTSQVAIAPVSTSSSSTSSSSTTSTSIYVAPTSAVVVSSPSVQATSTSSSAVAQSSSSGNGKRGLAYNTASLLTCFENNNQVTWGYNWDSDSAGLSSSFNYVPLLWGTTNGHTEVWNQRATSAIASGSTHLMSFNEPDMTTQANMSPEDAASAFKTYMMPFAGQAKLGAPAVTNGGGSMGLDWLNAFLEACDGCQIDFVTIHWYDSASNTAYFKEHVQNATDISGGKPVWVTEFAPTGASDSQIATFLEDVMPWMDSQDFVERYSYFMAGDGALLSGTEPSTFGQTYATYSG